MKYATGEKKQEAGRDQNGRCGLSLQLSTKASLEIWDVLVRNTLGVGDWGIVDGSGRDWTEHWYLQIGPLFFLG